MGRVVVVPGRRRRERPARPSASTPRWRRSTREKGSGWRAARLVRARAVVSNADPVRTLALLEAGAPGAVDAEFARRVGGWRCESPVVKVNCALERLPTFTAAPDRPARRLPGAGRDRSGHRRHPGGLRGGAGRRADTGVVRGVLPDAVRPVGRAAGAPHDERLRAVRARARSRRGTWDERREEIGDAVLAADRPLRARRRELRASSARSSVRPTSRRASV